MNRLMWANAATRDNLTLLRQRGIEVLGPAVGEQACGETGPGRMLEPEILADLLLKQTGGALSGLTVMITAGPTREPIDPVRYITNRSSGKMGYALAAAARAAGARVRLVSGPVRLDTPGGVERLDVETAEEMYRSVHEHLDGVDIFIGAAAISDYRPERTAEQKIKKTGEQLKLTLARAPDTLRSVANLEPGRRPFTVGFAAETERVEEHARSKLADKRLDMIIANQVGVGRVFDQDENEVTVLWAGGGESLGPASKLALARRLVTLIGERYRARSRSDAA
jgi:phosphopantothenoylcysteine decarboxylase/phosphopantothenate--cysteine ligase